MMIAPAALSVATAGASEVAVIAGCAEPDVVFTPATWTRSFSEIGIPWRGPRYRPARISCAERSASESAWASSRVMKAFSSGLASIAARQACTSVTGESAPD